MAQAEIIREFLVQLGFKTDEKSLKKFTDGVEGATKNVAKLVAAIAGAALTVGAGVAAFAANMEALYFASMKTGASAVGIKALSAAVQNLTGNGQDAISSLQGLARFMRETPESESFLKSLGVDARDANGQLRKTEDIMLDLLKRLSAEDYPLAKEYAKLFGIGEDTLLASRKSGFEEEYRNQLKLKAAYEDSENKAHAFMVRLRELQSRIEAVGVTVGTHVLDWLDKYNPAIQSTIDLVLKLVDALGTGAKLIMDFGFRATAGAFMMGRLAKGDIKGAREAARAMVDGMEKSGAGIPEPAAKGGDSSGKSVSSGSLDPMRFFMGLGWTKEQAAGIVANLKRESRMDPKAIGDSGQAYGIAQWHPDRQANFARWAGKDIRDSTLEEQMRFVHYELTEGAERKAGMLLRAAKSAEFAGAVMSRHYERPNKREEEAALRGAAAVSIAQNTTINVNGGDAAATGRAVASEQVRVAQDSVRNLKSVLN